MRHSILITLFLPFTLLASGVANPQDSKANWIKERQQLEDVFLSELNSISQWCRQNELATQAAQTLNWHIDRDPQRQYIFLPGKFGLPTADAADSDATQREWTEKLNHARRSQANRIFQFAKRAASAGAGDIAFQSLNETLFYNPDHVRARETLGHRKSDDGWRIASERVKPRPAPRQHNELRWPAKSYLLVTTPHFRISSKANEKETLELARKLERWHLVWRQVFFEFWSRSANVERWLDGKGKARKSTKQFDIVFFADRQQYVDELKRWVPGIEGSVGYYNENLRTSFFYASDDPIDRDTWKHEAAHQWFQESIRSIKAPFDDGFLWLGEGIAMYFESLADQNTHFTLGGFDARRLQYSRRRKLEEGFYIPLQQLSSWSREQLQQRPDLAKIYSQSSGLTHLLMTDKNGMYRPRLVEFLKLMYQGKLKPGSFEKILGVNFNQLDQNYDGFLKIDAKTVSRYLVNCKYITGLALPRAGLDDAAFQAIGNCHRLQWLDVAANSVTAKQIESLRGCEQLTQLFLTGCRIDPDVVAALASLPALAELDLSYSNMSVRAVEELQRRLPNLKITK